MSELEEPRGLLKLGVAFNASNDPDHGGGYEFASLFSVKLVSKPRACISLPGLGGLYRGVHSASDGVDFYPRLTAVAKNNAECNRLVNEQAEISLLLAGPGVIITMTFAPLVIALLYTTKFAAAVEPLRWICFLVWCTASSPGPMGFIVLAKGVTNNFSGPSSATVAHVGSGASHC